ncbi:MAG: glycosyltransferase family 9 protein [Candidatus Omnitrophica bacterium]|nr:glycosyltransferase family 9 protein [Candidatus Omnitrophota bacterium]
MKRILVVNPFGIGDALFSMQAVEALRQEIPDVFIGFLCNERTADLVRLNTSIDRTFVFNRDQFRGLWRKSPLVFLKELRAFLDLIRRERFDTLLDFSLGRQYSFFAMLIGIPRRIGFDYKGRGTFLTQKTKIEGYEDCPVAQTQLQLLEASGIFAHKKNRLPIFISEEAREGAAEELRKRGFLESDRILAVAPGGGRSWGQNAIYKQWDPHRFSETANAFAGVKVLLLGDESERALLAELAAGIKNTHWVVAGQPIEKVCALLSRSQALVCNDGGLLHLANALGVKTVSIFGPVDEKVYGPFDQTIPSEVMIEPVPCRPCYHRFRFPPCPYERRCLAELPTEKVVTALKKML